MSVKYSESCNSRLEATSNVVGVLLLVVIGTRDCKCQIRYPSLRSVKLTVTAVELVFKDLTRVLLGLLRNVGVVDSSLVAASDLSVRHFEGFV